MLVTKLIVRIEQKIEVVIIIEYKVWFFSPSSSFYHNIFQTDQNRLPTFQRFYRNIGFKIHNSIIHMVYSILQSPQKQQKKWSHKTIHVIYVQFYWEYNLVLSNE